MDDLYFDRMEEKRDQKLAGLLGITYDELLQTEWHINEETSNDDLVYNYIVKFDESSPKHILAKIEGLNDNNEVYLLPGEFGDDEDDEREDEREEEA